MARAEGPKRPAEEAVDQLLNQASWMSWWTGSMRAGCSCTEVGDLGLATPRDGNGSFEPRLVPKGQRRVGGLSDMIISFRDKVITPRAVAAAFAEGSKADLDP